MKKLFIIAMVLTSFSAFSASSKYSIDDSKVEELIEQSSPLQLDMQAANAFNITSVKAEKNVWIAVALDFFLGGFGIHRVYLDTPPGIIAGYFFTCGGIFGIVPLVDLIVLVINNDDISKYVGARGLFMW